MIARTRSGSPSPSRSRARSDDRHRRDPWPGQAIPGNGGGRRPGPRRSRGRDLRSRRAERGRQDDDPPDPRDASDRDVRSCRGRRDRRPPEPRRRPSRPRLHAGRVRGLRRHEGLGVPRLLRPLLRHPGRPPAADDRRPARAGRPRRQARFLRPEPVAGHAAAPLPRSHPGPRPAGAPARRAGVRSRSAGSGGAPGAAPRAPLARQDDRDQQPHPSGARGAVHRGRDRRPRPGADSRQGRRHRAPAPVRRGPPGRDSRRRRGNRGGPGAVRGRCPRRVGDRPRRGRHRARLPRRRPCGLGAARGGARSGDPGGLVCPGSQRSRGAVPAGHVGRRAGPSPGTGGLMPDELVDDIVVEPAPAAPVGRPGGASSRRPRTNPLRAARAGLGGITAVGVKELRGRARGRRAFVVLTFYLLFLGLFAWAWELVEERTYVQNASLQGGSAAFASAQVGQEVFGALILIETLLVVFLAPAFTSGAISLEREKQTLDMLAATPISSLAIVVGKLFSALAYVFLLIAASIPLTAIVFVFGGVGPDDVLRAYAVLIVTALGLGSMGLFISALMQRTQR